MAVGTAPGVAAPVVAADPATNVDLGTADDLFADIHDFDPTLVATRCNEPAGREIEMVIVCAVGSGSWLRKGGLACVRRALLGSHRAAATGIVSLNAGSAKLQLMIPSKRHFRHFRLRAGRRPPLMVSPAAGA